MKPTEEKIAELAHALKCAEVSLEGKRRRIGTLEKVLTDWLDCYADQEEWTRCRNNTKIALGRSAPPSTLGLKKPCVEMTPAELKAARQELGLTQQQLAAALDLSTTMIGQMERGRKKIELRTAMSVMYLRDRTPDQQHKRS